MHQNTTISGNVCTLTLLHYTASQSCYSTHYCSITCVDYYTYTSTYNKQGREEREKRGEGEREEREDGRVEE